MDTSFISFKRFTSAPCRSLLRLIDKIDLKKPHTHCSLSNPNIIHVEKLRRYINIIVFRSIHQNETDNLCFQMVASQH